MKKFIKSLSALLVLFFLVYLISMIFSLGANSISHDLNISFTKSHFKNPDFRILSPWGIHEFLHHAWSFWGLSAGGVFSFLVVYPILIFYFLLKVKNVSSILSNGPGSLKVSIPRFPDSNIMIPSILMVSVCAFFGYILVNSTGFSGNRNSTVSRAKLGYEYLFHLNNYIIARVFNLSGSECSMAHVLSVKPDSLYKKFNLDSGDFESLVLKMRYFRCGDIGRDLYLEAFLQGELGPDRLVEFLSFLLENGEFSLGKKIVESLGPDKIDFRIRYLYGRHLMGVNEFDSALEQFSKVVAEKLDFSDAFYRRGICLDALDKKDAAIHDFETAARLLGNHEYALKKIEILKQGN